MGAPKRLADSVAQVRLVGRVAEEPRTLAAGTMLLRVATQAVDGEVWWHRVVCTGEELAGAARRLAHGDRLEVLGRLEYTGADDARVVATALTTLPDPK